MDTTMQSVRASLERAVGKLCPPWLAAQRDDIVQNACIKIARILDETQETDPPAASYLWRAAHNAVMDEIRRLRRRREEACEDGPEALHSRTPTPDTTGAEAREIRDAVRTCLAEMAEDRRDAVLLYLQGYSLRETAKMLGWTAKRADNQRYQGLAELRRRLEERGVTP